MGFAPDAIDRMSLWQFLACADGWRVAHGADEGDELSEAEFQDLSAYLDREIGQEARSRRT